MVQASVSKQVEVLLILLFISAPWEVIWRVPCKIYPDFYRVHPDFSRVPPRPDFFRVLTWLFFFYYLQVSNPSFFKLPPWKKPGRSYPKKISYSTLETTRRGDTLEKSGCWLNGRKFPKFGYCDFSPQTKSSVKQGTGLLGKKLLGMVFTCKIFGQ